jgi:hypothetical protein
MNKVPQEAPSGTTDDGADDEFMNAIHKAGEGRK